MRPVVADDLDKLWQRRTILLLDASLVDLLPIFSAARNNGISTPNGIHLPIELWDRIISETKDDIPEEDITVQLSGPYVRVNEQTVCVRLVEVDVCPVSGDEKGLDTSSDTQRFEKFLVKPTRKNNLTAEEIKGSSLAPFYSVRPPKNSLRKDYTIFLPSATNTSAQTSTRVLYTGLTWPNYIAWMLDGKCSYCNGSRNICPGCCGADKYDAFMGCGTDLACPHCMGLEFCWTDKEYCHEYYDEEAPREVRLEREGKIRNRLRELGYLNTRAGREWVHGFLKEKEERRNLKKKKPKKSQ